MLLLSPEGASPYEVRCSEYTFALSHTLKQCQYPVKFRQGPPMSYAILRTAKLKSMGEIGGSLSHTFRTRDTPNADPQRAGLNEHGHGDTPESIKAALAARLPEKRRSDAVLCVEYFIGASPEHFADGKDGSAYFADAVAWLKAKHGAENVIATAVHRDETSPHLVAYVVPLDDQGKLNAKAFLGGKAKLSAMQTDFADSVGRKHGLERGLEGSKATHTAIREYYGHIGQAQEKTPSVDVPEPKLSERVNVKVYGERVAESVLQQIGPELIALRAKAAEVDAVKRELKQARKDLAGLEFQRKQFQPILKAIAPLNTLDRKKFEVVMTRVSQNFQDERAAEVKQAQEQAAEKVRQAVVDQPIRLKFNEKDQER